MTIYSGIYFKELEVEEGNVNSLFVNDNYIFKRSLFLFFLEPTGFELATADIFIRTADGWINILTGSIIYDVAIPLSSYDVVLTISDYTGLLTDDEYTEIIQ